MKQLTAIALGLALAGLAPAHAAEDAAHHGHLQLAQAAAADAMAEGTVRKIKKDSGKITIKHGPLARLNMPPMTMVFRVEDPAILDAVAEGDKVVFVAEDIDGTLTVTEIRKAD